jgi:hypothetical protein
MLLSSRILFRAKLPWLKRQHLDIFIPGRNVGVEHHGIRHYEAIDYFGGEAHLKYVKQLDRRKRRLQRKWSHAN